MTRYATHPKELLPDLLALIDAFAFTVYPALVAMFAAAVLVAGLIRHRRQRDELAGALRTRPDADASRLEEKPT